MVALAAKKHAVPFVILTGLHKLSPEQPFQPEVMMNDFNSPVGVLDFEAIAQVCVIASTLGTYVLYNLVCSSNAL
jgi:translation initiation factor eIF-2B subunit beta